MTTFDEIINKLKSKGLNPTSGDSDETSVIVWNADKDKVKDALKGLKYTLTTGYDNGIVIFPKE